MSPLLFGLFFDRVYNHLAQLQLSDSDYRVFSFAAMQIFILLFADDAVLIAQNEIQLQKLIDAFSQFCAVNELRINTDKTNVMLVNCTRTIICNSCSLKQVANFQYLGLKIDSQAKDPTAILADRI